MFKKRKPNQKRNFERRLNIDRRELSYDMYFPEKRSGHDRRQVAEKGGYERMRDANR